MSELIVVVGPTAAGKTELGAELARRVNGEVISADAFAVYRGLDIGTAKPPAALRAAIPHHLIDVADPRQRYSAGMYIAAAEAAICEIRRRGKVPVVVGGTLFYVRALLYGLFPEPPKDAELRRALEREWTRDADGVRARLAEVDPVSAARIAAGDRQRTLRALEVSLVAGRPMSELWREHPIDRLRYRSCLLCAAPPRDELRARIEARVVRMFSAGLVEEVRGLLSAGVSPTAHAMKAIGYRECCDVVRGVRAEDEARRAAAAATRRLAKRQMTWLRGERGVRWLSRWGVEAATEAMSLVEASIESGAGTREGRD